MVLFRLAWFGMALFCFVFCYISHFKSDLDAAIKKCFVLDLASKLQANCLCLDEPKLVDAIIVFLIVVHNVLNPG